MTQGNRNMLSESMMSNETPIIYSTTHNEIIKDDSPSLYNYSQNYEYHYHYYITSSHSQGFQWNQDLFVTQYQQNYQVEYDGHEDSIDETLYNNGIRKYRRKSENSISFKDDAKNGINLYNRPLEKYIDCGDDAEEEEEDMKHFRWLLS
ncbi:hypothetical protein MOUN0_K06920 [Monosporozyma unispora]|nr:hypothetical protein C6P44_004577 [Kazachstania unispora]